ncbi:hypothetical protein SAMN04488556_0646 [Halostagnicola kamekurae]|uniref:DUF7979 domain-containing protein n=1 Tax=Halostagnicola kamekurae TaxID=619731 RepID=A0A1I6PLI6_9EURY|nr:hypothetical protein SAMN04488556_0646 [Halostagnicola kamekurae]
MDLAFPERSQIILGIGIICLVAGTGLLYLGFPTHTTSIIEQEPSEEAMATVVESYSASESNIIEFSTLSSAEQTAVTRASQSPQLTYTDRGASDSGSHFEYRNDVVNRYFVSHDGSVYLVHVVVVMSPLSMGGGVLSGIAGITLVVGGVWNGRRSD